MWPTALGAHVFKDRSRIKANVEAFNYLTVMVSVVVGLGLTQLLAGIGNFVQIRRRVAFYWLHTGWVGLLIILHLHMWWSFWVLREVAEWTYGTFVFVLIGPATLVIASPSPSPR